MPIFHECDRCTACCRWPGQVRLSDENVARMSEHLGMSEFDFIQKYTELNASRTALLLKNRSSGACVMLDDDACIVNPVKPQQCRDFPNLWNFPGFESVCHAKPREVSVDQFRALVRKATGRDAGPDEVRLTASPLETNRDDEPAD